MKKETIMELLGMLLKDKAECVTDSPIGIAKMGEDIRIVILQRGWVYIGKYYQSGDECWLENASCIRNWGTTRGLGELAQDGPNSNTKLDPCPPVRFHRLTIVATIDTNQDIWSKKL